MKKFLEFLKSDIMKTVIIIILIVVLILSFINTIRLSSSLERSKEQNIKILESQEKVVEAINTQFENYLKTLKLTLDNIVNRLEDNSEELDQLKKDLNSLYTNWQNRWEDIKLIP